MGRLRSGRQIVDSIYHPMRSTSIRQFALAPARLRKLFLSSTHRVRCELHLPTATTCKPKQNTRSGGIMDKRDFLKTSGALVAGTILSRFSAGQQQPAPRENWAGNITYSTDHVHARQPPSTRCAKS